MKKTFTLTVFLVFISFSVFSQQGKAGRAPSPEAIKAMRERQNSQGISLPAKADTAKIQDNVLVLITPENPGQDEVMRLEKVLLHSVKDLQVFPLESPMLRLLVFPDEAVARYFRIGNPDLLLFSKSSLALLNKALRCENFLSPEVLEKYSLKFNKN